jgi:uncharacterized radical SAM protein YgiQ
MQYDIILITPDPYVDHPFSGTAIIKNVLEDKGFKTAVIDSPNKESDFQKYGKPKCFFGISGGAMDSMVINYTALKKRRDESEFSNRNYKVPDRAVIYYCNMIRKSYKDSKMVIGGIESSLRRFAHYDFWDNKLRKSILLDSRADILIYGYGEKQILEIAKKIKSNKPIDNIKGTCMVSTKVPDNFSELPTFDEIKDKKLFCEMQNQLDINKNLAQKFDNRYVLQNSQMEYTQKDLDYVYGLKYIRKIPKHFNEFKIVQFSILTHRGCFGNCNFCSIAHNSGKGIISRSKESILKEIKYLKTLSNFKGVIELSGASANMYGMDCELANTCKNNCLTCDKLDISHKQIIDLLQSARKLVDKINIKSGIRYDLAVKSPKYIKEIIKYHIDFLLMVAPEHRDRYVLKLMNKEENVDKFIDMFNEISNKEGIKTELSYYLMVGHPGCTIENSEKLRKFTKRHKYSDYIQIFTPTPMTVSTCMYYTGLDPKTLRPIYVPYSYNEKKRQKNAAIGVKSNRNTRPGDFVRPV